MHFNFTQERKGKIFKDKNFVELKEDKKFERGEENTVEYCKYNFFSFFKKFFFM